MCIRDSLGHIGDAAPQRGQGDVSDVLAVDQDPAAVHVHETQQQLGKRRLARSRRPDQRHVLARLDRQGQVLEEAPAGPVAEADVAELHPPARDAELGGVGAVGDLDLDPGDGGEFRGPAERPGEGSEVLEGLLQAQGHLSRVVEDQVCLLYTSFSWLFTAYVIFGVGFGFVNAPITNAAVSGMPRAQAGVASGIASTSRQVGQTLGVAVVGALVTSKLGGSVHLHFAAASHAGWWTLAGCAAGVLVLGLVSTSKWGWASAQRTARELNPEFLEGHGR